MKTINKVSITNENLANRIHFIRGQKVMLDRDLAELYGVETKRLKEAVKRNPERFPDDFMFELTLDESIASRSQFATLKRGENLKYLPYAFTEQGVAMLSSVLKSKQAIAVNIQIIRVFTKMREIISSNKVILVKLDLLEKNVKTNSTDIQQIFSVIRKLINPGPSQRKRVGYKLKNEE